MKIYSTPPQVPAPKFNPDTFIQDIENHKKELKQFLIDSGFTGENTGKIAKYNVADGTAEYMVMEVGSKFALIHLPYLDGYEYHGIEHFPKSAILKQIEFGERMEALFTRKG